MKDKQRRATQIWTKIGDRLEEIRKNPILFQTLDLRYGGLNSHDGKAILLSDILDRGTPLEHKRVGHTIHEESFVFKIYANGSPFSKSRVNKENSGRNYVKLTSGALFIRNWFSFSDIRRLKELTKGKSPIFSDSKIQLLEVVVSFPDWVEIISEGKFKKKSKLTPGKPQKNKFDIEEWATSIEEKISPKTLTGSILWSGEDFPKNLSDLRLEAHINLSKDIQELVEFFDFSFSNEYHEDPLLGPVTHRLIRLIKPLFSKSPVFRSILCRNAPNLKYDFEMTILPSMRKICN